MKNNIIHFTIWHCGNECIFLEEIKRICHKNVSFCMPLKFHTYSYGISQNVTSMYHAVVVIQRNGNAIKVITFENEPYHSVSFSFCFFSSFVCPISFPSDNLTLCLFSHAITHLFHVSIRKYGMEIESIYSIPDIPVLLQMYRIVLINLLLQKTIAAFYKAHFFIYFNIFLHTYTLHTHTHKYIIYLCTIYSIFIART